MTRVPARFAVFLAAVLLGSTMAMVALGDARAESSQADACASAHVGCVNACDVLESDDAGRAGCSARCAADRAVCEAGEGLDSLAEQTNRIKGFLDGLTRGAGEGGATTDAAPLAADCDAAQEACSLDCRTRYYDDEGALAGCASRCMADNAVCQAEAELKAAAPKVKKEVDRWTRFLEGFLDEKGGFEAPEGPAPGEEDAPQGTDGQGDAGDVEI